MANNNNPDIVVTAPPANTHYRIRKEYVLLCVAAVVSWASYHVYDYFRYVNWPPHDGSNLEFIKSLNCSIPHSTPSVEERENWEQRTLPQAIDRRNYLVQPQGAAIPFLVSEGSHTRVSFDIVDTEKKKRTARVVITFE